MADYPPSHLPILLPDELATTTIAFFCSCRCFVHSILCITDGSSCLTQTITLTRLLILLTIIVSIHTFKIIIHISHQTHHCISIII